MSDPVQYEKRDAAWVAWLKQTGKLDQGYDIGQRAAAKFAFDAGWEARKAAQYAAICDDCHTPIGSNSDKCFFCFVHNAEQKS